MSNINKSFSNFAHDEAPSWTAVRSNIMHCWAKLEFDEAGGLTVTVVGVPGNSHDEEVVLDEFRYAPPQS
jgi:acid phosphatase type 7